MNKKTAILLCFLLGIGSTVKSQYKSMDPDSWTTAFGYTRSASSNLFNGIDLRFISSRFQIETEDDYWTEEKEKNPEKFKKARMYFDFMYAPRHSLGDLNDVSEFSTNADILYSLLHGKHFSIDVIAGMRFYFQESKKYGLVNFKKVYYWDSGFSAQWNFGFIAPFIEIKRGLYYTIGTEIRLHSVYRKPKRKYKIH